MDTIKTTPGARAGDGNLPQMPVEFSRFKHEEGVPLYTADQMRAYALAAREAALEETRCVVEMAVAQTREHVLDELAAAPAVSSQPVAWMDDGTRVHNGPGNPVFRVITADTKRNMPESIQAEYPTPLYAAPAVSAPAWQPIETAPRGSGEDGPHDTRDPAYIEPPRLLLSTAEGIVVGYYDWYYHPGYGRGADPYESPWRDTSGGQAYAPTHWMPLPAAPESQCAVTGDAA